MADRDELTFEQIEDALPDGEMLPDGRMAVSAQQLHDFAHAVSREPIQPVATQEDAGKVQAVQMSGDVDSALQLLRAMIKTEKPLSNFSEMTTLTQSPHFLIKNIQAAISLLETASQPSNAVHSVTSEQMPLSERIDALAERAAGSIWGCTDASDEVDTFTDTAKGIIVTAMQELTTASNAGEAMLGEKS